MSEQKPLNILEKRSLDEHLEASVMDNGIVILSSLETAIETALSPEQASNLLDLLYTHRYLLYKLTHIHPLLEEQGPPFAQA